MQKCIMLAIDTVGMAASDWRAQHEPPCALDVATNLAPAARDRPYSAREKASDASTIDP